MPRSSKRLSAISGWIVHNAPSFVQTTPRSSQRAHQRLSAPLTCLFRTLTPIFPLCSLKLWRSGIFLVVHPVRSEETSIGRVLIRLTHPLLLGCRSPVRVTDVESLRRRAKRFLTQGSRRLWRLPGSRVVRWRHARGDGRERCRCRSCLLLRRVHVAPTICLWI